MCTCDTKTIEHKKLTTPRYDYVNFKTGAFPIQFTVPKKILTQTLEELYEHENFFFYDASTDLSLPDCGRVRLLSDVIKYPVYCRGCKNILFSVETLQRCRIIQYYSNNVTEDLITYLGSFYKNISVLERF